MLQFSSCCLASKKKKSSLAFPSLSLPSLRVRFESQHQNGRKFRREWGKNNPLWVGIDEWAVLSRLILRSLQPSLTMFLMPSCTSVTNFLGGEGGSKKKKTTTCFKELFLSFLTVLLNGKVVKTWWYSNIVLQSVLLLNWFFDLVADDCTRNDCREKLYLQFYQHMQKEWDTFWLSLLPSARSKSRFLLRLFFTKFCYNDGNYIGKCNPVQKCDAANI